MSAKSPASSSAGDANGSDGSGSPQTVPSSDAPAPESPSSDHMSMSPTTLTAHVCLRTSGGAIVGVDPTLDFDASCPPSDVLRSSSSSSSSSRVGFVGGKSRRKNAANGPGAAVSRRSAADPFAAQRAAAMRCELSELRDTVASQAAELKEARSAKAAKSRELAHTRQQLRDAIRAREDAIAAKEARQAEQSQCAAELEAARTRFRARSKRLRARIEAQDSQLETVTGRCSALDAKSKEAFRVRDRMTENARLAEVRARQAEGELAEALGRCRALEETVRGEKTCSAELREQCDAFASRERDLRESAALLAQYQQDLAEAMSAIRSKSLQFLKTRASLCKRLDESDVAFMELERKCEAMALSHQKSEQSAKSRIRSLEAKASALAAEKREIEREARQERDAHIRSQSSTRRQLDSARRSLSDEKAARAKIASDLEDALEAKANYEQSLASVRAKLERAEAREKETHAEQHKRDHESAEALSLSRDECEGLKHALAASQRREEEALAKSQSAAEKYRQVKQMVRHLAEANGQVARVYAALGSRLTEVRAAQAAARGGIEASREGLLFLRAQVEEARARENLDRELVKEKDMLLRQKETRLKESTEEILRLDSEWKKAVSDLEKTSKRLSQKEDALAERDNANLRINAELLQSQNHARQLELKARKTSEEIRELQEQVSTQQLFIDKASSEHEKAVADLEMRLGAERAGREAEEAAAKRAKRDADDKIQLLTADLNQTTDQRDKLRQQIHTKTGEVLAESTKLAVAERERQRMQVERNELAEEIQDRKEMYLTASERLLKELEEMRHRLSAAQAEAKNEHERAEAMQRLAGVLRERAAAAGKAATAAEIQIVSLKAHQQEIDNQLASAHAAMRGMEEASQAETTAANRNLQNETNAAAAIRAPEDYPLGFHLAIEQLVQAVRQRRSLFGCVVDSLEDAFRAMDSSGRGSLEESDIARALKRLDIEMSPAQLRDLLNHLDANGDGVVDAGEFLEAMRLHEEQMKPTPTKSPQQASSSLGAPRVRQRASPIRQPRMRVYGNAGGDLLSPVAGGGGAGGEIDKPKWRR